jgi:NTE family protein
MMDITLALGGGGVKGHAHIGVLRVLEREGFRIRAIAGTSAGGLWGVFYAAGYNPDEMEQRSRTLDLISLLKRQPGDGPGMLGLTGVFRLLQETLGDCTFEDLRLPFAVTAVDLDSGREVYLRTGKVVDAILATIAIPGVFPPKELGGRMLIDGGVIDPVPVALARLLAPQLPVVAVVLSPPIDGWTGPVRPRLLNSLPFVGSYIANLSISRAFNIFLRSIDIGGALITEQILQLEQPDVIIRPAVPQVGLLDPVIVPEMTRLGEVAAEAAVPEIYRALSWRSRLAKRFSRRSYPRRTDGFFDGT